MKRMVAAVLVCFATGAASAQAPAAPEAPIATPAHKKASPAVKHKKAYVKKERIKKAGN
jgi:hypothetical protein